MHYDKQLNNMKQYDTHLKCKQVWNVSMYQNNYTFIVPSWPSFKWDACIFFNNDLYIKIILSRYHINLNKELIFHIGCPYIKNDNMCHIVVTLIGGVFTPICWVCHTYQLCLSHLYISFITPICWVYHTYLFCLSHIYVEFITPIYFVYHTYLLSLSHLSAVFVTAICCVYHTFLLSLSRLSVLFVIPIWIVYPPICRVVTILWNILWFKIHK